MHGKIPRLFHDGGIALVLLRWPFSCETRSPPGFLRGALPNGRVSYCLDNTPACECSFGNPPPWLRSGSKPTLALACSAPVDAELCPPGKYSNSLPADRGRRSVAAGPAGWFHSAHFPISCFPENRSLARPTSRCCPVWCIRHRPPSVAVFSSAAVPRDPPPAVTPRCRLPPAPPPPPPSVHAPHRWKSVRCS